MIKIKSKYRNSMVNGDIILEVEMEKQDMLEVLIEVYQVSLYSEDKGLLPVRKICNLIEKATGLKIEEVLNQDMEIK